MQPTRTCRWRVSARAALLPFAITFSACRADPVTSDGALTVAMSADRTTATPTAPVQLTITLTNRSSATLTVPSAESYGCPPSYVVQDVTGRSVELPPRYCILIAYAPTTLAPGAQMVLRETWAAETRDAAGNAVRVAPGVYRIRASVSPLGRVLPSAAVTVVVP